MGINIKEIKRKKNEFIDSIHKLLVENDIRTEDAVKKMNELNKQASKNIQELSRLLS